MNKNSNEENVGAQFFGLIVILLGIALILTPLIVYIIIQEELCLLAYSLIFVLGGYFINKGIGDGFCGDKYEFSHVSNGQSIYTLIQTPKVIKRLMWYHFIEFIIHIILSLVYIILIFTSGYILLFVCFSIFTIIIAILYFYSARNKKRKLNNY